MTGTYQAVAPRLEAKSVLIPFCGCKLWFGPSVPRGYGVLSVNGRQTYAHRAAWELANGPIIDGLHVLHECDVPACINVAHLFLGTPRDNTTDMISKGRADFTSHKPRGSRHRLFGSHWSSGESNRAAKLTANEVGEIRRAYASGGVRQIDLAAQFGVKQAQISKIVRGESWVA